MVAITRSRSRAGMTDEIQTMAVPHPSARKRTPKPTATKKPKLAEPEGDRSRPRTREPRRAKPRSSSTKTPMRKSKTEEKKSQQPNLFECQIYEPEVGPIAWRTRSRSRSVLRDADRPIAFRTRSRSRSASVTKPSHTTPRRPSKKAKQAQAVKATILSEAPEEARTQRTLAVPSRKKRQEHPESQIPVETIQNTPTVDDAGSTDATEVNNLSASSTKPLKRKTKLAVTGSNSNVRSSCYNQMKSVKKLIVVPKCPKSAYPRKHKSTSTGVRRVAKTEAPTDPSILNLIDSFPKLVVTDTKSQIESKYKYERQNQLKKALKQHLRNRKEYLVLPASGAAAAAAGQSGETANQINIPELSPNVEGRAYPDDSVSEDEEPNIVDVDYEFALEVHLLNREQGNHPQILYNQQIHRRGTPTTQGHI